MVVLLGAVSSSGLLSCGYVPAHFLSIYCIYICIILGEWRVVAGDDVKSKKPDPSIYVEASRRLGVSGKDCIVIEDSVIGLQAATGAGMPCVITYTCSTADQVSHSLLFLPLFHTFQILIPPSSPL